MRKYSSSNSRYKPRSIKRLEKKGKKHLIITILISLGIIYFLLTWGLSALIGGLSFFNKFKGPQSNKITSVIDDPAIAPPVLNIPYEATSTATIKISGYASSDSQIEIYIDDELKDTAPATEDGTFLSNDLPLSLGTNNIFGKTINKEGKRSLPSKTIRLLYSNEKPKLQVSEPTDGQEIQGGEKKIRVLGKTDSSNTVTVNGVTTIVSSQGTFSTEVPLNEGENSINVSATNNVGNSTNIQKKVIYKP